MDKRQWFLCTVVIVLAGLYMCFFTSWFKPTIIRISNTTRPVPSRVSRNAMTAAMMFSLDGSYRLTDVKVVPLAEWQANHSVLPLWHLVSDSKSAPTKFFVYGHDIDGMKPIIPGAQPKPLQTNVVYRLFVSTSSVNGQHDFQIGGKPANK
jgi:hypothetical protein